MNNKIIPAILILSLLLAACRQPQKTQAPAIETTGDAAVDTVGKDLNNVDGIEKDLSTEDLNDLDAGLADVENI